MPTHDMEAAGFGQDWATNPRWADITRPYAPEDVLRLRGSLPIAYTLATHGAERLWQLLHTRTLRRVAGRADRQPGGAAGARRAAGDLPERLAGGGRREPGRADVSRPEPLPRQQRAAGRAPHQRRPCSAPTRSSTPRASDDRDWFAPIVADGEAGFGGAAERLRADEGDDRGGRGGRAFRGPAGLREEVRAHGRQGADPDRPARSAISSRRGWPPTCWACRP